MAHTKNLKRTKMKKQKEQTKRRTASQKRVLKCLEETHGVVTSACKKAKIGRTLFYKWCKEDEGFKKEVDEIQDATLDFVEGALFKQIEQGNITGQIFYLKTKGKHRGYVERQEIKQETSGSITFDFN
jgi:hypothetical protein